MPLSLLLFRLVPLALLGGSIIKLTASSGPGDVKLRLTLLRGVISTRPKHVPLVGAADDNDVGSGGGGGGGLRICVSSCPDDEPDLSEVLLMEEARDSAPSTNIECGLLSEAKRERGVAGLA